MNIVLRRHEVNTLSGIIIHCSIFSHSHWLRAYDEFFVSCWWREHMTNNCRICHVLTPSELFVNVYNVQISAMAFARFASVSAEQIEQILEDKDSENTKEYESVETCILRISKRKKTRRAD